MLEKLLNLCGKIGLAKVGIIQNVGFLKSTDLFCCCGHHRFSK